MGRDENHAELDPAPGAGSRFDGDADGRQGPARRRAGIEVIGPTDHALFKSIYFFDPSGHRLGTGCQYRAPGDAPGARRIKWDMLEEWAQTKEAPSTPPGCMTADTWRCSSEARNPESRRPRRHPGRQSRPRTLPCGAGDCPHPAGGARQLGRGGAAVAPVYEALNSGAAQSETFDAAECHSPLPRAYQWADGSAYINHVELVRKARNAELPPLFTDPLMYQGGSDSFVGPRDTVVADPAWGIDFEAGSPW